MTDIFTILKERLPNIQKNIPLKVHTTFKIGGSAEYFLTASKKDDVVSAIQLAKKIKLPIFVFGGGSNLLVADKGIRGLVIKIENSADIYVKDNDMIVHAGVPMKALVEVSIRNSLAGLEWAGGLPGTFGGAIRGNAGAFGGEMKDAIFSVEALDNRLVLRQLNHTQCQFAYRTSIFKKKNWIILSATVRLKKGNKKQLQDIAKSHIAYRQEKHPLEYSNAGSVFKNIPVKGLAPKYQKEFADKIKQDPFLIVPAAWFIIGAGLAGKKIGGAQISKKHSNYIVNTGKATAKDVLLLIQTVKKKVKQKYGINLEMEVQYVK